MKSINSSQKITPFLWYNNQAEAAMNFYVSVFPNSEILLEKRWPEKSPFPKESTVPGTIQQGVFTIDGFQVYAFDAGPTFSFNPSISFYTVFETSRKLDETWNKLMDGGQVLMPLDRYDWSDRYGWITDRYGMSWQLSLGQLSEVGGQRITPLVMYSGAQQGRAEEALSHYLSIFKNSSLDGITRYEGDEQGPEGMVKHAQCHLAGQPFMLMDNGTDSNIPFTEAISFYVNCKDQTEVDHYWESFTNEGKESVCGWLKDKYGVSWQIVPDFLTDKMRGDAPEKQQRMMDAILQMKKLDVEVLKKKFNGVR